MDELTADLEEMLDGAVPLKSEKDKCLLGSQFR